MVAGKRHEYEFRLVALVPRESVETVLNKIATACDSKFIDESVYYAKPNFRFRRNSLETKKLVEAKAVYHDGLWFRWVHSIEIPFRAWSLRTRETFVSRVGNDHDAFSAEKRRRIDIDGRTQIYAILGSKSSRLVFEWEYGTFDEPLTEDHGEEWLRALSDYAHVYECFAGLEVPPYINRSNPSKQMSRKKVVCVSRPLDTGENVLVAHKWDGIFGFVHSERDKLKEMWEGYRRRIRSGKTLGDGIAFAAEKLAKSDGGSVVVLLDVYKVRGDNVARWSKRAVLTQFLPSLSLPRGYVVQEYRRDIGHLPKPRYKTDGFIYHDVVKDEAYKVKTQHSLDVVYRDGYFWLIPVNMRFKCTEPNLETLQNDRVYEVSADDGRIIRIRQDRSTGNTMQQIMNVFDCTGKWTGEPLEPVPPQSLKRKRK